MTVYNRTKEKYGCDIASWIYGLTVADFGSERCYDCWTFTQKTRKARENTFHKLFGAPKENYKPEPVCLN